MHPRAGLALSLLAACGIHAGILLVPRADFLSTPIPTVEIDLAEAPPAEAAMPVVRAGPRVYPAVPAVAQAPAPAAAPLPLAASSPQTLALPEAPEPSSTSASTRQPAPEETAAAPRVGGDTAGPAAAPEAASAPTGAGTSAAGTGSSPTSSASARSPLIPPQPRAPILPVYPRGARTSGLQGVVKVSALVDPGGAVTSAEVLISSGSALLDRAALDAVRRAAFTPATQGGYAVACRVIVPIRFQLSGAP
jgi:periplasmic protein TonB